MKTTLENVVKTWDGETECYDAVVKARDIATLSQTGFLRLDPEHQRGKDQVTGKLRLDMKKVERWAEQLIEGGAYLGQLSWNFRKDSPDERTIEYDPNTGELTIEPGAAATIPDSYHRHLAIVKAVESAAKGSRFDANRPVSVRIYNVRAEEENRIFYAMNEEGRPADATRSKWLHPVDGPVKLARKLVESCPHLRDNVDTIRDRLSKRNPRICAFGTLAGAFSDHWKDLEDLDEAVIRGHMDYLVRFWERLVTVRPELGKLNLKARQEVRKASLVDSAMAIRAYVGIARRMQEEGRGLAALEKLAEPTVVDGREVDFFSRPNPLWEKVGVLVPMTKEDGTTSLQLRNARQAHEAMFRAVAERVGLKGSVHEAKGPTAVRATKRSITDAALKAAGVI